MNSADRNLISLLFLAVLVAAASSSSLIPPANANFGPLAILCLYSEQANGATTGKGTVSYLGPDILSDSGEYTCRYVHSSSGLGEYQIGFVPFVGYEFVRWRVEGGCPVDDLNSPQTSVTVSEGFQCALTAIYLSIPVGGVVTPANTFALVAPWIAVIALVGCIGAVVVVVARKRRP